MSLTQSKLAIIQKKITGALSIDRHQLTQEFKNIRSHKKSGQLADRQLDGFIKRLNRSCQKRDARLSAIPFVQYQNNLPIAERRDEIKKAILDNQVIIIAGETGSGKTTQLPKICLELGRGSNGIIGHTQPRRIAARAVAVRIAEELGQTIGQAVGYQVRFRDESNPNTLIKLMTDGILLAEVQHDPYFSKYDTIIIDEAHERSLNIDFLLGYLKTILPKRPDLKLIITSATIDIEKFSKHFNGAPVIKVLGRTYPVEVQYIQPEQDMNLSELILEAIKRIISLPERGDILVFHSGEREIRETANKLLNAQLNHLDIVPLYSRLSLSEQSKVFSPHKGIRVVLSTNVAETSLTVPGIRYVIDPGMARISRYSFRTKVQRLPIEPISQASANQRKGRCGRLSNGVCFRLYTEDDFNSRDIYTDPEIVRTNLASVILKMLQMKIGDIRKFDFLEAPDSRLINDGYSLLKELEAVTSQLQLTNIGKKLSKLPVDPKFGRMLLASEPEGSVKEVLIIVSALSIQDPRERPADQQADADSKHLQWKDQTSDFSTLVNLWRHFEQQHQELSRSQFDKYCRKNYISAMRMREWRELYHQLHTACRDIGIKSNKKLASYESVHRALLTGLLGQVGFQRELSDKDYSKNKQKNKPKEFIGSRNRIFNIFPSSCLSKKPPKWLMAAGMIETSKLFSHNNAKIDPEWLPALASHLTKKSYSEPHYSVRKGQVMAYEKQTLYGLPIIEKKLISYAPLDQALSREIFIQSALVEGGYRGTGEFFHNNLKAQSSLLDIESKIRRRGVLVDDSVIFNFYDSLIPKNITSLNTFESWRTAKELEQGSAEFLYIDESLLLQENYDHLNPSDFPDNIHWDGTSYATSYRFDPGQKQDGVTVTIPISILHQVPLYLFDWIVPGMLRDKCIALLKGLPKSIRRNFVPASSYVDKFLEVAKSSDIKLTKALGLSLHSQTGINVSSDDWSKIKLDDIFYVNFELIDKKSHILAVSKNIEELKSRFKIKISDTLAQVATHSIEQEDIKHWSFGDLPEIYTIVNENLTIKTYPALIVEDRKINLKLVDNSLVAINKTLLGLNALYQLIDSKSVKYLKKNLLSGMDLQLKFAGLESKELLTKQIIDKAYFLSFLENQKIPRNKSDFEFRFIEGKSKVISTANELDDMVTPWTSLISDIRRETSKYKQSHADTIQDIDRQLNILFCDGFLFQVPIKLLRQYHRYLKSILIRLEKLRQNVMKEQTQVAEIANLEARLKEKNQQIEKLSLVAVSELWEHSFLLQEYRVSLFSQGLKTVVPVSRKRIDLHWKKIQNLI